MGLLDPTLLGNLNKLKGLLGETPIGKYVRGKDQGVSVNGLKQALLGMPVFSPDAGESAYEAAMNIGPMGLGKIVYHGSPHKFDKFDASKIGTGEGAQAYGHGVYLADAEDVAKGYQKTLAYKAFDLGQEAEKRGVKLSAGARGEFHRQAAANRDPMRAAVGLQNANISARELPQEKLAELFDAFQKDGTGALYKADLPDEWIPKMLDWDKPIKDQKEILNDLVSLGGWRSADSIPPQITGEKFYRKVLEGSLFPQKASSRLSALGISGIRYLDGGSRSAGKGSYNYVVFPGLEDQVKILERNSIPINDGLLGRK